MSYINLKLSESQLAIVYDALVDYSMNADSRSDDMADNIDDVTDSYWIGQLVDAKIKQRKTDDLRSYVRDAVRGVDDIEIKCASEDKLADKIRSAINGNLPE